MMKLSRSKIELLLDCPRCFWLDMNKSVRRVPPAPYTINSAIDYLLKAEFDNCRLENKPHYLFKKYNIDAIPYKHEKLSDWRNNFTGVQFFHEPSGFLVFGALDDLWVNPQGELSVVDYKATGANECKIYDSYKRQIEIYQWLLRQNGFKVAKTGYFLFARADKLQGFSGGRLSFDLTIQALDGDSSWVEKKILEARSVLNAPIPAFQDKCLYCDFAKKDQAGE